MATIAPFRAVRPSLHSQHEPNNYLYCAPDNETQLTIVNQRYRQEKEEHRFVQDPQENFYIYQQTKTNTKKSFHGIIASVSIDSYMNGTIKIHENTIDSKESFFREYLSICNFCDEPVLIAHPEDIHLSNVISSYGQTSSHFEYTTKSSEGLIVHRLWLVNNLQHINLIQNSLQSYEKLYIADGHHRSASSVFVGQERRKLLAGTTGAESFNYFMCLFISFSELEVYSINRVISDLHGKTCEEFLLLLHDHFYIDHSTTNNNAKKIDMYIQGKWYQLQCKETSYVVGDPVKSTQTYILENLILKEILGIETNDKRVEFIGGHLGKSILEDKVNSGAHAVAFLLPPLTFAQIRLISDQGKTIPAKSTWIEPKLPRGLTIFDLLS